MSQAPPARADHSATWTGSSMIVWGGSGSLAGGAVYDPATDGWTPTSRAGEPTARSWHTAVWTGTRMIVWGGWILTIGPPPHGPVFNTATPLGTGGVYDPSTDTWMATSTVGAPSPRVSHTAVWTGSRLLVWGGGDESMSPTDTGGIYDPAADTWRATPVAGAPAPRTRHTMVWTGSRAIVWGGLAGKSAFLSSGGLYDDRGLLPAATDYTVTPWRLVDTRAAAGPALAGGSTRSFTVTGGTCGVPPTAVAVSVNVTAAEAAANGNLVVFPGNSVFEPSASTRHFAAGVNRANNAVVLLATDGSGSFKVKNRSAGAVRFVLDLNGYFE